MAGVKIDDAVVAGSIAGTEKIPISGSGNPAITPNLLKTNFGTFTDYVPTFTGFSTPPTIDTAKYCKIGNLCVVVVSLSGSSVSNTTAFTITLPFNAGVSMAAVFDVPVDAGAGGAAGQISLTSGSNVANLFKSAGASWTASGIKRGRFCLTYITA